MDAARLILDTDLDTDCDDVGALALLEALARRGEAQWLGVVCSVPVPWTAACAGAVLQAFGRHVPVGLIEVPGWTECPRFADYRRHRQVAEAMFGGALYNEMLARPWLGRHAGWKPEEAVALYRRLLAAQPDGSVTICAIGTLTALAQLLDSGADEHSPLPGEQLVKEKVGRLVTMAEAAYPEGADCFNWAMDKPASARVVGGWPGPLAVSRCGREVLTGGRFSAAAPPGHPAAEAYVIHRGGRGVPRSSWDQLAVLYAVRGAGALWREEWGPGLCFDEQTGRHDFAAAAGQAGRAHLQPLVEPAELAAAVEELMLEALA